ncbi:hypothetical protein SDC9_207143 [bioreactor metagenome]|uniref:Lipoprotein n=1 Tax=bioreactor metagenome TaxID=1076179 RepID=A0A645J8H5_9ZZZZ
MVKKCAFVASILLMMSIGLVPIVLMSCANKIPVYTICFDSQVGSVVSAKGSMKGTKR